MSVPFCFDLTAFTNSDLINTRSQYLVAPIVTDSTLAQQANLHLLGSHIIRVTTIAMTIEPPLD